MKTCGKVLLYPTASLIGQKQAPPALYKLSADLSLADDSSVLQRRPRGNLSFSIFCLGNQISQITFEKCYQRYRVTNLKRGPHFIYCLGQTGSVKERVCNDDLKDSRRIRDKPMVNMRAECCSANLQLAPQWQFHAAEPGLQAGRSGVAQSQPWSNTLMHNMLTRDLCVLSAFCASLSFPTVPTQRQPLLFSLPPLQQESCST